MIGHAYQPARITPQRAPAKRSPPPPQASPGPISPTTRRELLYLTVNVGIIGSVFTFGVVKRKKPVGVVDYGGGVKSLYVCPPTPNCIGTSDLPAAFGRLYNPQDGRGQTNPVTQKQAMDELASVVSTIKPDRFTPTIIEQKDDYLYAEFQSPTFGFIDDVEFWFPSDRPGTVEYRSSSRIGESDGNINRKRIRAIRKELEKIGWESARF